MSGLPAGYQDERQHTRTGPVGGPPVEGGAARSSGIRAPLLRTAAMGQGGRSAAGASERDGQNDRATQEAVSTGWPILICVLGIFRVLKGGRAVLVRSGGKAEALLLNLSTSNGNCSPRATLLSALWPGRKDSLAGQSLNTLVYALRRQLGDAIGGAAPVVNADGYYRLNAEAGVNVDVACFDVLARTGEKQARLGNLADAAEAYSRAARLYRGDLCVGTDVRDIVERERVRALYLTLLARLAEYHYSQHDYEACLKSASDLLANDPCREDAHRMAMRCYVRRGERTQALRQYRVCEAILRTEFDVRPEPATTALFEQIQRDPGAI